MTQKELINEFELSAINKAGARCDFDKAQWFNQQHLQRMTNEMLVERYLTKVSVSAKNSIPKEQLMKICSAVRERLYFSHQLCAWVHRFASAPKDYDKERLKKSTPQDLVSLITKIETVLEQVTVFSLAKLEKAIHTTLIKEMFIPLNLLFPLLRIALLGISSGPSCLLILDILGKEEVLFRLKKFKATL